MTSIKNGKETLRRVITRWGSAVGDKNHARAWQEVEVAITALDNAAYDRAYEQARENAADWHQVAIDRAEEIRHLTTERDELRTTSGKLIGALGRIEVMSRNSLNDANLLPALKRVQAEAWEAYRNAQATVLPIGEPIDISTPEQPSEIERLRAELADARGTIRKMAEGRVSVLRDEALRANRLAQRLLLDRDRLRKALETLADRYHARVCNRKLKVPIHYRRDCTEKPYGVVLAEKALAVVSETPRFPGKIDNVVTVNRALTADDVKNLARELASLGSALASDIGDLDGRVRSLEVEEERKLFDDRNPQGWWCIAHRTYHPAPVRGCVVGEEPPQPEIEAVLMGTEIVCVCGCDTIVDAGQLAYRFVHGNLWALLYASPECARKAARPKV